MTTILLTSRATTWVHCPGFPSTYQLPPPDQDAAQSAEAGDRYRFLNESDIVGGLAAVEEHYRSAIARCESALLADLKAFLDRQTSCLDIAYQCLGGRDGGALHRSDLDFDDSSGVLDYCHRT